MLAQKETPVLVPRTPNHQPVQSGPPRMGIQRNTLTVAIGIASLLLAIGSILISLYIFEFGLKGLQHAQTQVHQQTVPKVINETITAAAEAKYAPDLNRLRTVNARLESDLIVAQKRLAQAEAQRAKAQEGVLLIDSEVKGIGLGYVRATTGDPQFQAAVKRLWGQFVTPAVECFAAREDESKVAFDKRCAGKNIFSTFQGFTQGTASVPPYLSPVTQRGAHQ